MTSSNKGKQIPEHLLRHISYLRQLHLEAPRLGNTYLEDTALHQYTKKLLGNNEKFKHELTRLGDRFSTVYLSAARNAQENHPRLEEFNSFGQRINKLHLSEGWKTLSKYSAQDGIVQLAYEKDNLELGNLQRFGQLIVLYMYHPSSGLYGCPLAMTDGAAYVLRNVLVNEKKRQKYLVEAFDHLTSRKDAWTSGQWMTEKKGGSDVSNTETIAVKDQNEEFYRLYGYKWFTSATDSNMTLALGKILPKGVECTPKNIQKIKVSLFFIKLRKEDGQLNGMQIVRLKDKLGTRQLPTAQILLKGAEAYLVSQEGQGVKYVSGMLKVTRIYNAATAVGLMRRGLALSRDYAERRKIGNNKLSQMPLQLRVLSKLETVHRGNLTFYLKIAQLFSKEHARIINDHEANILRVFTPLLKLFTGKQCLTFLTQILQSFGGMGYIQGTMIPSLLRDAQVLSIWQGTTNVLCYDFVRALMKKQNKYWPIESLTRYFMSAFQRIKLKEIEDKKLTKLFENIIMNYNDLFTDLNQSLQKKFVGSFGELRTYCFGLSRLYISVSLLQHALSTFEAKDFEVVERWIHDKIYQRQDFNSQLDRNLAMDIDVNGLPRGSGDYDSRKKPRSRL